MQHEPEPTAEQPTSSWKLPLSAEECNLRRVPFKDASQLFAVDASGSTSGRVMTLQQEFTERIYSNHGNDQVVMWGSTCDNPIKDISAVPWTNCLGGTDPSKILQNQQALEAIGTSDVWYLLTDGEVWGVPALTRLALDTSVVSIPTVFVITGSKGNAPSNINISVGIAFYANAPDVMILFKDIATSNLYIIAGKGCFAPLLAGGSQASSPDLSSWDHVKALKDEAEFTRVCEEQGIRIPSADSRPSISPGVIRLGATWEQANENTGIDINLLLTGSGRLEDSELKQLLAEEAFNNLAVACKTRGTVEQLRTFLLNQKHEEIVVKLEDVSEASDIITQLNDQTLASDAREALQRRLRAAHANNRKHYQILLQDGKEQRQQVRERNDLVNNALEQLGALSSSNFTAEILDRRSNRAKRAGTVAEAGEVTLTILDLDSPAFRGECRICCGEDEIMSIAIKTGADVAANTDNFALDFPLAAGRFLSNKELISSQMVCFQCTLALNGQSLFREELKTILPTLEFKGGNRKYIESQLFIGLTGGLRTGASGVSQLFMTILDQILCEKGWAGGGNVGSEALNNPEVKQRRAMLTWMLTNLLENTSCRETFNSDGPWVTFRQALIWAAKDFRERGVDSWAVGYPLAGFTQLVSFGRQLGSFDHKTVCDLRLAKLLHTVASKYLEQLLREVPRDQAWKQSYLELIYSQFNAPLIPTDKRGSESLVNSPQLFWKFLQNHFPTNSELLAHWDEEDINRAMRRVQMVVFWLVYFQTTHTRAKSFFQNIQTDRPLSIPALDVSSPALANSAVDPVLLGIFRGEVTDLETQAFHARHCGSLPLFVTPFGPSVLRCGYSTCAELFVPIDKLPGLSEEWTLSHENTLRAGRAAHLIKAFAVHKDFAEESQTGMPTPTTLPIPPKSRHANLHISVARVWARLDKAQRVNIAASKKDAVDEFVREASYEVYTACRGNVFERVDDDVRQILPSFLDVLKTAIRVEQGDGDITEYVIDFDKNKIQLKAKYEMMILARGD
ncbi:hypothetical protein TWF281_000002 [Arthrobotrys megalospora]